MSTSYPVLAPPVNGWALRAHHVSFYRWLCRLSLREGYCWASTPYLAAKQGVSERTIYRWLASLRAAEWIECDTDQGVERRVVPLVTPPKTRLARPKKGTSPTGVLSGVKPLSAEALEATDTVTPAEVPADGKQVSPAATEPEEGQKVSPAATDPELVGALEAAGVKRPVAVRLALTRPEECRRQLRAHPLRKSLRNPSGALVAAIMDAWTVPTPPDALRGSEGHYRPVYHQAAPGWRLGKPAYESGPGREAARAAVRQLSSSGKFVAAQAGAG